MCRFVLIPLLLTALVVCSASCGGGGVQIADDIDLLKLSQAPVLVFEGTKAASAKGSSETADENTVMLRVDNPNALSSVALLGVVFKADPDEDSPLTTSEAQGYFDDPGSAPANVWLKQVEMSQSSILLELPKFKGSPWAKDKRYWAAAIFEAPDGITRSPVCEPQRFKLLPPFIVQPPEIGFEKEVFGTVVDYAGSPLADVPVVYVHEGSYLEGDYTDENGEYYFTVQVPNPHGTSMVLETSRGYVDGPTDYVLLAASPTDPSETLTAYMEHEYVDYNIDFAFNEGPTAQLVADPDTGEPPLLVTLDSSGSTDPDHGVIVRIDYDFDGDGIWDLIDGDAVVQHMYAEEGVYDAAVKVFDACGAWDTASVEVIIGAKICFAAQLDGQWGIYLTDSTGSHYDLVVETGYRIGGLAFSPDGTKIAFHKQVSGSPLLFVVNTDGTGLLQLTYAPTYADYPTWQDNDYILFEYSATEDEIMRIKCDGTELEQISPDNGISEKECWLSPDSLHIAFTSAPAGGSAGQRKVYVADFPSFDNKTLVGDVDGNAKSDGMPCWSYATNKIAFGAWGDGVAHIHLVNPDGTGLLQLSPAGSREWNPRFSSDGSEIVFQSWVDSEDMYQVFVMSATDGGNRRRLTYGFEDVQCPDWHVPR